MIESPAITIHKKKYANNAIKDLFFLLTELYKQKTTTRVRLYIQASENTNISNVHLYCCTVGTQRSYTVMYSLNVTVRQFVVMSVINIFPRKGWKDGNVSSFLFSWLETDNESPFSCVAV